MGRKKKDTEAPAGSSPSELPAGELPERKPRKPRTPTVYTLESVEGEVPSNTEFASIEAAREYVETSGITGRFRVVVVKDTFAAQQQTVTKIV